MGSAALRKRRNDVAKGTIYEGLVATRAGVPYGFGGNPGIMSRSSHVATTDIRQIKLAEANCYFGANDDFETNVVGGTNTYWSGIEFNSGFAQVIFGASGPRSPGVAPGGYLESSYLQLPTMIPRGSRFFIRRLIQSTSSVCIGYNLHRDAANGDLCNLNATVDQTMGGTISNTGAFWSGPFGIIGPTNAPSVGVWGDSICLGPDDDTVNAPTDFRKGIVCHGFPADTLAFLNHGNSAIAASNYISGSFARKQTWKYLSHIIDELGRNDLAQGGAHNAAALEVDLTKIRNICRQNTRFYRTTLIPGAGSPSGNWFNDADQGLPSWEAQRLSFNTDVRAILKGYVDFFETDFGIESVSHGGFWASDGVTTKKYTLDGTHPSAAGYALDAPAVSGNMDKIFYP